MFKANLGLAIEMIRDNAGIDGKLFPNPYSLLPIPYLFFLLSASSRFSLFTLRM